MEFGGPGGHIQGHLESIFNCKVSKTCLSNSELPGISWVGRGWSETPHLFGSCVLVCVPVEDPSMQAAIKWIQYFSNHSMRGEEITSEVLGVTLSGVLETILSTGPERFIFSTS